MKKKLMITAMVLTAFAATFANTAFAGWSFGWQEVWEPCGDGFYEKYCELGSQRFCFEEPCG